VPTKEADALKQTCSISIPASVSTRFISHSGGHCPLRLPSSGASDRFTHASYQLDVPVSNQSINPGGSIAFRRECKIFRQKARLECAVRLSDSA
jgi:hypothetical protein